jgi:hypothetical protein
MIEKIWMLEVVGTKLVFWKGLEAYLEIQDMWGASM